MVLQADQAADGRWTIRTLAVGLATDTGLRRLKSRPGKSCPGC